MSSTNKTDFKSDYLQPLNSNSYDSNQSPLALLAQTCSSIGKESSTPLSNPNSTSLMTSIVNNKTSSLLSTTTTTTSNSSMKRSSTPNIEPIVTNKKLSTKTSSNSTCSSNLDRISPSNYLPSRFDSKISSIPLSLPNVTTTNAASFLRSSLTYLAMQQQTHSYSSTCSLSGCIQCQTIGHILSSSMNIHPYLCHWYSCNARFSTNDELIEHIRRNHSPSNKSSPSISNYNSYRFHPYFKPTMMINNMDQLPYFYPHLALSTMTSSSKGTKNNNK